MPTLLITGVSGMLGWTLANEAAERFDVAGWYGTNPVGLSGAATMPVDVCDAEHMRESLDQVRPDVVVHLAAIADTNQCQRVPALSRRVNLEATMTLAEMCARRRIPMIFTSTDLVFAGDDSPYAEDDEPGPINVYGMHKAGAERGVKVVHAGAVVCRLPLMFGPVSPAYPKAGGSFVQEWLNRISVGETMKFFTDEFRTPISAHDASQGLLLAAVALLEGEKVGTLHLGGAERVSRHDFAMMMCEAFELPRERFEAGLQRDVHMAAPRPKDVALSSERARAMGWEPGRIIDGLRAIEV